MYFSKGHAPQTKFHSPPLWWMFAAYVKSQFVWINITNKAKINKSGVLN